MPWVRLDDSLFRSPAFAGLPDDSARLAYLAVAAAGSETTPPGEWPSRAVMAATMPGWVARRIPSLIAADLLDESPERVRVKDRTFYPAETPEALRKRRAREGRSADGPGTVRGTHSLSSSSTSGNGHATSRAPAHEGLGEDWYHVATLAEDLTGQAYALPPFGKLGEMTRRMIAKHGADRLAEAMTRAASEAGPMPTIGQVILGASGTLDAIPRVRGDCETCWNMGVTRTGRTPCPDCGRREPDITGARAH